MADLTKIFGGAFVANILSSSDLADPVDAFRRHCEGLGLDMSQGVNPDGEIHRVPHISSKRGALDGWYLLHDNGGPGHIPAGVAGCWKEPIFEEKWRADIGRSLTLSEQIAHGAWMAQVNLKKAAEKAQRHEAAAERAEADIQSLPTASHEHPYLLRKRVQPHGIKVDPAGRLVIPVTNVDGVVMTHQTIDANGDKRFLKGGEKDSGFFELRGNRKVVVVVEGFATGASVFEATGYTVLVAFDCGNLPKVAKVAKELFVTAKIIIGADNDAFTDGNPGIAAANKAALAVGGEVVYPVFSEAETQHGKPTDFNDLHCLRGIDAVKDQVERVVAPTQAASGFEFTRADGLVMTEIDWQVEDYFESDSLSQIFGDPGGGKSFVALDLSLCIAAGIPWHGHAVKPGAVFYIAGEGHNGLTRRINGWALGNGVALAGIPFFKSHRAAQFYNAVEAALVAESIKQMSATYGVVPAVIVIDTLARNMGADENSTEDMNAFITHLDLYLRQRYQCCVLLVHHSGAVDKDRSRGSTALRGALDAEYKCSKLGNLVTLEAKKMKDADLPALVQFEIATVDLPLIDKHGVPVQGAYLRWMETPDVSGLMDSIVSRDNPEPKKEVSIPSGQQMCLDALEELLNELPDNEEFVSYEAWRILSKTNGFNTKNMIKTVAKLVKIGAVVESGSFYKLP